MRLYRLKTWLIMKRIQLVAWFLVSRYKFGVWIFQWNVDEGGDIVFSIAGLLHFVKYKEHTIVKFGIQNYARARKYVEAKPE